MFTSIEISNNRFQEYASDYLRCHLKDKVKQVTELEHLSDYLRCHMKGKVKQATQSVKLQSVLCEDAVSLKISVTKICGTID